MVAAQKYLNRRNKGIYDISDLVSFVTQLGGFTELWRQ